MFGYLILSRYSSVRRAGKGAPISGRTGTGNYPGGARVANRGWKRPFDEPIPLPRAGRQLATLEDAGTYRALNRHVKRVLNPSCKDHHRETNDVRFRFCCGVA